MVEIIQKGGLKNRVRYFDVFSKKLDNVEFDATEKFMQFTGPDSNNKLPVTDTQIQEFAANATFNYFIAKDSNRPENFIENMLGGRTVFNQIFNAMFVRVMIPGDSSIKVGDVVELNIPQATGQTGARQAETLVGGNYIVTRLRHNITTMGKSKHYIAMDCNKVGFA